MLPVVLPLAAVLAVSCMAFGVLLFSIIILVKRTVLGERAPR